MSAGWGHGLRQAGETGSEREAAANPMPRNLLRTALLLVACRPQLACYGACAADAPQPTPHTAAAAASCPRPTPCQCPAYLTRASCPSPPPDTHPHPHTPTPPCSAEQLAPGSVVRLLSAVAELDVQPSPEWVAPFYERFWAALPGTANQRVIDGLQVPAMPAHAMRVAACCREARPLESVHAPCAEMRRVGRCA